MTTGLTQPSKLLPSEMSETTARAIADAVGAMDIRIPNTQHEAKAGDPASIIVQIDGHEFPFGTFAVIVSVKPDEDNEGWDRLTVAMDAAPDAPDAPEEVGPIGELP